MMRASRTIQLLALAAIFGGAVLAGCQGGTSTAPAAPSTTTSVPAAVPTTGSGVTGSVTGTGASATGTNTVGLTISVRIPQRNASAAGRSPQYVSYSTRTISVSINGGTPITGSCPYYYYDYCTLSVDAPVGSDTLVVKLLDGATTPNLLSTATTTVSITQGYNNNVSLIFKAVVNSIVASFSPTNVMVGVPVSLSFAVVASDAGGNQINSSSNNPLADGTGAGFAAIGLSVSDGASFASPLPTSVPGTTSLTVPYNGGTPSAGTSVTVTPVVPGPIASIGPATLSFPASLQFVNAGVGGAGQPGVFSPPPAPNTSTVSKLEISAVASPAPSTAPTMIPYTLRLAENQAAGQKITITDSTCATQGLALTSPGLNTPVPYAATPVPIAITNSAASAGNCAFTATDSGGNTATLNVYFNKVGLVIQGKGHK